MELAGRESPLARIGDFVIYADPCDPAVDAHVLRGPYEPHVTWVFNELMLAAGAARIG
ncbi:MAG: hypothetical protein ACHP7N_04955 [Caulobacterales bacterium]